MSYGYICDFCGVACQHKGVPHDWWTLSRHEGRMGRNNFPFAGNEEVPVETARHFCCEECLRGWIANKRPITELSET